MIWVLLMMVNLVLWAGAIFLWCLDEWIYLRRYEEYSIFKNYMREKILETPILSIIILMMPGLAFGFIGLFVALVMNILNIRHIPWANITIKDMMKYYRQERNL